MNGFMSVWAGLDAKRRIIVAAATIGMFAAIFALTRGSTSQDMALLYSGLDGAAAGEIITALEQRGVAYEVRGDAIFVPSAMRDIERMMLASEGLPASGAQGYELLDSLSGFGTTSQMFDAAYWRAKEGELARTIVAVPNIRAARVHISAATNRPFRREDRPTAAVTVTTSGGSISASQAQALRFLVAAAVSGMRPEDVAIIDSVAGLIPTEGTPGAGTGEPRTAELQARAARLLEARVGPGNAVVEVSVETVTESEQIVERRFDPESRVAISTETEESTSSAQGTAGGDVTVASNLPDGDAAGEAGGNRSEDSQTRNVTNFEVSETSREIIRAPGDVRRLTVAVLVNDVTTVDAAGVATTTPRSEEELAALSDLVGSAVGLDESRGDVITVRSMPFEPVPELGTEAVAAGGMPFDLMELAKLGVLALTALILGLFVVRPILANNRPVAALPPPEPLPSLFPEGGFPTMNFDTIDSQALGGEDEDPVARLRQLIEEREEETVQILQSWIEDPDTARARA